MGTIIKKNERKCGTCMYYGGKVVVRANDFEVYDLTSPCFKNASAWKTNYGSSCSSWKLREK